MASSDLNLNNIAFQSQLRDKPVRENFTDIQNEFNALRSEFQAGVASTAGEVVSGRDNFTSLVENIHIRKVFGNAIATATIAQTTTPSMKIHITAGSGVVNGVGCEWVSATSGTVTAPVSNSRIDLVVANTDNSISIVGGTATASPPVPDVAVTQYPIAKLTINSTTGTLTDSHIQNYNRPIPTSQVGEIIALHPDLTSTLVPNQYHYSPCDGVELLDTTNFTLSNDTKVPDLTDDRFLMGDTTYSTGGNSNNDVTLVTGNLASHSHTVTYNNQNPDNGQTGPLFENVAQIASATTNRSTNSTGSGTAFDIRPLYFSVLYYIRIR